MTKRVEALQLAELLGSLMAAVVDSQAQSARATVDFVEAIGFEETPKGKALRTVSVRHRKLDENDNTATYEVEIPLLAMVNVPSLAVKEARFSLAYDIVTASANSDVAPATGLMYKPALLKGYVRKQSPKDQSERQTTSVDVDIVLEQQGVPLGVERLFDLAELGITDLPEGDDGQ